MTDLTVLVSPLPLYPDTRDFTFGRRSPRLARPIMVTLETEIDEMAAADENAARKDALVHSQTLELTETPASSPRRSRSPRVHDNDLLSPPVNTWKSRPRPRHRPTRSQSAPPERRALQVDQQESELLTRDQISLNLAPRAPTRSFTSFTASRPVSSTRGGELVRPPPPLRMSSTKYHDTVLLLTVRFLVRPTTFWRKTRRSGVTGASYSPSSHLIRRSTYIAAGLQFDAPVHDLSALCVESRVGFIVIPHDQTF